MSEYIDIITDEGYILRIVHEMTTGDLLISSLLALLIFYKIIKSIMRILWSWRR